jgi:hypothetical protein
MERSLLEHRDPNGSEIGRPGPREIRHIVAEGIDEVEEGEGRGGVEDREEGDETGDRE